MNVFRHGLRRGVTVAAMFLLASMVSAAASAAEPTTIIWKIDQTAIIGGQPAEKLGQPRVTTGPAGGAVSFDGKNDGLLLTQSPLGGCRQYTIEVLFRAAADGPTDHDQKLLHIQDSTGTRALMEVSLKPTGAWSTHCGVKAYLKSGPSEKWLWDRERKFQHAAGQWYWLAMTWDGGRITSFVDGQQEQSLPVDLIPLAARAPASIGVRLTKIDFFKGEIAEMRFTDAALPSEKLQHAR